MNRRASLLLISSIVLLSGCGYRLANRRFENGVGQTIGVPTFINITTSYRLEQRLSEAIRRELVQRTRFGVTSENSGDLVVVGEVQGFSEIPILFDDNGRATSYSIAVNLKIGVVESQSGQVLLQNDQWTFREVFELARASEDFVLEDSPAVDRLVRRAATAFVSSLLYIKP